MKRILQAMLCLTCCVGGAAVHASEYKPLVVQEHYLGADRPPLELTEISPESFRFQQGYAHFKGAFEEKRQQSFSDETFRALLSDRTQVELRDCQGEIYSDGMKAGGATLPFWRDCYKDEKLIYLLVDDDWQLVASQGCLNPVLQQRQPAPVAKPEPKPEPKQELDIGEAKTLPPPSVVVHTPEMHVHDCDCGHVHCGDKDGFTFPSVTIITGGGGFLQSSPIDID